MATAEKIEDATARERAVRELEQQIAGINEAFEHNELDYGRKLYLIENCIYGVDKRNSTADTSTLEREIDLQVYVLYGLTPEEIKIVEDSAK